MQPVIIYHNGCPDGFCAAWIAHRALKERDGSDATLIACNYNDEIDVLKFKDHEVYVVDFSFDRETTEALYKVAEILWVIDHHQTAEKALEGLPYCKFDMTESGASLTWRHFYPGKELPWVVQYVKDRDLWQWNLRESKAVAAFIMAIPHELEEWDDFLEVDLNFAIASGKAIWLHVQHYIERTKEHQFLVRIDGQLMRCVNAPYMNISDLLHEMCDEQFPVCIGFFWRGNQWQYSLRSIGQVECAKYAEARGGGGHKDAAGFESKELIPEIAEAIAELAGH